MEQQKIIWTVLPNGFKPGDPSTLRLSVFVSPRLSSNQVNPTLALFEDFLDWPSALQTMDFGVQFGNNAPVPVTQVGETPDSALWQAMFTNTGGVESYDFPDQTEKVLKSYPYKNVESFVKEQFQDIILDNQTELPASQDVAEKLEPIMLYDPPEIDSPEMAWKFTSLDVKAQETVGQSMMSPQVEGKFADTLEWDGNPQTTHSRLQTGKIHPELNSILSEVPNSVYEMAVLDLMHLAQEASIPFKTSTVSAINSLYTELASNKAVNNDVAAEPTKDFLQVTFFHRPKQAHFTPVAIPTFDFHEACAALSNYPYLMRKLGLVLDFEVPMAAATIDTVRFVPVSSGGPLTTSNLWSGSDPTEIVRPKTKYDRNNNTKVFRPKSKENSEYKDGMLDVSGSQYSLSNLDVDGAAMKMMGLANTLRHFAPPRLDEKHIAGIDPVATSQIAPSEFSSKATVVEEASLPALRTAGISLVKTNQAKRLVEKMDRAKVLNADASSAQDDSLVLWQEDLVKGYRVDVRDNADGVWRSLCLRKGEYYLERTNETIQHDDEGWVELGASSAADQSVDELQKTWYVAERLTNWAGWSKVAPHPGKKIVQPEDESLDDTWNDNPNESETDFGLATNFKAQPGTLPRLRYGHSYRLRLRLVDLAGNGLTLDEAGTGTDHATAEKTYTRFEPIPAPFLVPKTGIKPGESVEHVVVRSNFNETAADYANIFPLPEHQSYPSDRHIVPPRVVQKMAEEHGLFDDPNTGKPMSSAYTTITNNDAFFDPFDAKQASKAVRPELEIGCPWLPDVAHGTAFRMLPGMGAGQILKIDYGPFSSWPELKPFILRLEEGSGAPTQSTEGGITVVTVKLEKSDLRRAKFSSWFTMDELQKMAVWEWLQEAGGPDQQKALDGLNWSLTPYRGLTFIHVVQQPLDEPEIEKLSAEKELGDTFAMLSGKIAVHGQSSASLDMYAEWDEPIDNLTQLGPKTLHKKNIAFEEGVSYDDTHFEFPPPEEMKSSTALTNKVKGKGALGVVGAAKSLTTYKVQNTPAMAAQIKALSSKKVTRSANMVAKEWSPEFKLKPKGEEEPAPDERIRHDFGDTKYRRVRYRGVAASRFREYFLDVLPETPPTFETLDDRRSAEQDSTNRLLTRTGDTVELDILNSARPSAPKILYVVPSFAWEKQEGSDEIVSKRVSGLRIWMERPWYSTGDGEKLGIVVWPTSGGKKTEPGGKTSVGGGAKGYSKTNIKSMPGTGIGEIALGDVKAFTPEQTIPEQLVPFVTQWGIDPLWMAGKLRSLPKLSDFLNPAMTDTGLSMAEFPGSDGPELVSVAAYDVGYDWDRKLWYCDIEVDPHEAYFPFIRMALARYQPKSVVDAHLSRIVTADFIQIAPDRSATITFDNSDPQKVRVAVTGIAYRASAAGQFPSEVEVTVETATGPTGDLQWIPAEGADTFGLDRLGGLKGKLWDGLWAGDVELPAPRGDRQMRLVIREFEVLLGDGTKLPPGFDIDGATMEEINAAKEPELQRRLVYADVIEI